jgi:hypothetical protein
VSNVKKSIRFLLASAAVVALLVTGFVATARGATASTGIDLSRTSAMGLDFSLYKGQPQVSSQEIAKLSLQFAFASKATAIEYHLMTMTTPTNAFSTAAVGADTTLAQDLQQFGHPVNLPVWVVSYEGLTIPSSDGRTVNHEQNVVFDAASGQWLLMFTYR